MRQDSISQVEIDKMSRLHIVPASETFPYIWREAMEVHWDDERQSLYGPQPREWSQTRWLRQILDAARAQGCELRITEATRWVGVDSSIKADLVREASFSDGAR